MTKVKHQFQVWKQKVKPTFILINNLLYITKKVILLV